MAIKVIRSVTVECDDCGFSFDEFDVTPAEEMEQVRKYGWTGTHRKCWCPDCSKRREARKMAVRPIDAVQVLHNINLHHRPTPVSEFESGFNDGLNQAMWEITHAPTLTQPNEGAKDKDIPTNEPLTLDDLRKIDTVTPLWVHDLSWGRHKPRLMLVRYVAGHYWSCVDFDGFEIVKADDYGSRYLIYCRPPEGGEEENDAIEITENL